MARHPFSMTVNSTHTRGNQRDTEGSVEQYGGDTVLGFAAGADALERRRLGRRIEEIGAHPLTLPFATMRASALTTKVNAKRTKPAAMYAPVGRGALNSAAAEAIFEAKV